MTASLSLSRAAAAAIVAATIACGGSNPAPGPSQGTRTDTFAGTSSVHAGGGCSGATSHQMNTAGAGTLVIAVAQASLAQVGVQVCHPGAQYHALECTVPPFATIAAGGSLTATIKGARSQTLVVYPTGCDTTTDAAATLSYTVNVTYPF